MKSWRLITLLQVCLLRYSNVNKRGVTAIPGND